MLGEDGGFCRGDLEQDEPEFARQRTLFPAEETASAEAGKNENTGAGRSNTCLSVVVRVITWV